MTSRFFINPSCFHENGFEIIEKKLIHQIADVLRMKRGEYLILLDNTGMEYEACIEKISREKIEGNILKKRKNENEPEVNVTLYQALPKKIELFEFVLQKGTEIGVKKFVPLITKRTERRDISKIERLKNILKEAAEQSGRGIIPELTEPAEFKNAILNAPPENSILFDPSGKRFSFENYKLMNEAHLFVGPEGGFDEEEVKKASEKGIKIVSLGKRILRTETAGIVAVTSVLLEK